MLNILLIDFGASRNFTHHIEQINGFTKTIESIGGNSKVILPLGAECRAKGFSTRWRTLPASQTIKFKFFNPTSWISSLIGKFVSTGLNISKPQRSLIFIVFKVIVQINFLIINYVRSSCDLFFPTACPASLSVIRKFEQNQINVKVFIRFTNTAEIRGNFIMFEDVKRFINDSEKFHHVKVVCAFEMPELIEGLKLSKSSVHSPYPVTAAYSNEKKKFEYGFYGKFQSRKGLEQLLVIVKGLISSGIPQAKICLQVPKVFCFLLEEHGLGKINVVEEILSIEELNRMISQTKIVLLPYDVSTYKRNSSALAYRCMDNLVPVATFRGSAFAREICEFKTGFVFKDATEAINSLEFLMKNQLEGTIENIKTFNSWRIQKNYDFLTN